MANFRHPKLTKKLKIRFRAAYLALLAISSASASAIFALPVAAYTAPIADWNFDMMLESAERLERQFYDECEGDADCELAKIEEYSLGPSPDGIAIKAFLNSPFMITRIDPQTGFLDYFFNELSPLVTNRDFDEKPEALNTPSFDITWEYSDLEPASDHKIYFLHPREISDVRPEYRPDAENERVTKITVDIAVEKYGAPIYQQSLVYDIDSLCPRSGFQTGMECKLYFGNQGAHYHYSWPKDLCPDSEDFSSVLAPGATEEPTPESDPRPSTYPNSTPYPDHSLKDLYEQAKDKASSIESSRDPNHSSDSSDSTTLLGLNSSPSQSSSSPTSPNQLAVASMPLSPNTGEGIASSLPETSQNLTFLINIIIVLSALNLAVALMNFAKHSKFQKSQKKS